MCKIYKINIPHASIFYTKSLSIFIINKKESKK
nr:MAG TPA: hypothetical protein [Inoviridae sp.]